MTKIMLFGATGRMGQAIADAIADSDDIAIVDGEPDVFIDFSSPHGLADHLDAARAARRPIVIGTTGLDAGQQAQIERAARDIAVLQSANMSMGVTLLAHLVREAAARLGPDWDIEIVEMHHRQKLDAPSGTALLLGEAAAAGRGSPLPPLSRQGRAGMARREPGTIGFASLRGGTVAGDHQVVFAGEGERIEFGHRAESRAIFAQGAIRAALWLADRPPGLYAMRDVLGLT